MSRERLYSWKSMLDLMFILAMCAIGMFVIALLAMRPPVPPTSGPDRNAEYILEMTWPDGNFDDIDMWVLLPNNKTVSFKNKDVEGVSLDRDDLGAPGDTYTDADGQIQYIRVNRETIAIRGIREGRFVVNVQVYMENQTYAKEESQPKLPYAVNVKLIKLNPHVHQVINKEVMVEALGQQVTAFTFWLNSEGQLANQDLEDQLPFIAIAPPRGPL